MQADNEDRYSAQPKSGGLPIIPMAVVVLALLAVGYWYFSAGDVVEEPVPETTPSAAIVPAAPIAEPEPAPDIPAVVEPQPLPEPNEPPAPPPQPALTLDQSDPVVREKIEGSTNNELLTAAMASNNLIERSAALVDLTSQGRVEPKLFPLPAPSGNFAVITDGDNSYIDPASYARYDAHAKAVGALDPQLMASAFHQFRPLLEQAYGALGYKAEDMDNNLIKALDQVIDAPVLKHPAILEKDVTTYVYADESIEGLSPLAKQLLRMGPENQALIQAQAKAIRKALLSAEP